MTRFLLTDARMFDDFIKKIRNEPQLGIPKDFTITLHGPSGTAISVGEPISSLVPGNSSKNPLRVQVSALPPVTAKPASDPELTSFWSSLHGLRDEEGNS